MTETAFSCLSCGGNVGNNYMRGCRDLWCDAAAIVDYVRCGECGLVQQYPVPEDVRAFYENYPIHSEKPQWYERIREAVNSDICWSPQQSDAPLYGCDFGCGDGSFIAVISRAANVECCGYEYDTDNAQRTAKRRGVPVYSDMGALADKAREVGGFHFITMHNVVEHLPAPCATLCALAALLRPGGEIYAVAPFISSFESRLFGGKWSGLDAPRHICFPEKAHYLKWAAQCGLQLRQFQRARFAPTLAGSLSIALTGRLRGGVF